MTSPLYMLAVRSGDVAANVVHIPQPSASHAIVAVQSEKFSFLF
jgi:hypothetical protein